MYVKSDTVARSYNVLLQPLLSEKPDTISFEDRDLWRFNTADNNKIYLVIRVMCPTLTKYGLQQRIFIKSPVSTLYVKILIQSSSTTNILKQQTPLHCYIRQRGVFSWSRHSYSYKSQCLTQITYVHQSQTLIALPHFVKDTKHVPILLPKRQTMSERYHWNDAKVTVKNITNCTLPLIAWTVDTILHVRPCKGSDCL